MYLLLALFLSMKVAGLHALSHLHGDDSAKDCVICDYAVTPNYTPVILSGPDMEVIPAREEMIPAGHFETYDFIYTASICPDQLFSRPPPSFIMAVA
ncbi:hypothetical protein [Sinomicrobium soli]|uniref:hypothetical protein n=1 Tax=Sinomicrobium sp. N-1-3-6 TaxID=2219864 RepID=UPI0011BF7C4C|nr:hypothetical protein [Sinomicrobium sp. N-1-3-6]